MFESDDEIQNQSYWPSVTDLFLTLFIIAIAIVAVVFCALLPTNNVGKDQALIHAVGNDLSHVREPMNRLREALKLVPISANRSPSQVIAAHSETCHSAVLKIKDLEGRLMGSLAELEQLRRENETLKRQLKELQGQLNDKPPNIQIIEKEGYRFESGSSAMGEKFIYTLTTNEFNFLATEIISRQEEGRVKVDTLEIIGHTDGVPLTHDGNLDAKLPEILAGSRSGISSLVAGSNNDLGLLRALAVREQWERYVQDDKEHRDILRKINIRCYSAGQTILPFANTTPKADDFRKPNENARRIEMRLTRLSY